MRRRFPERSSRSRFPRAAWLLACAIALTPVALACGKDETSPSEPAATPEAPGEPAAQPAPGQSAAPAGESPAAPDNAVASEGVIPEGYPSDVPVYPGATPGSSMTMPGLGVFATFESNDPVDKIQSHYRGELGKNGWSVVDSADGSGLDATKGSRSVQVRLRKNEEGHSEIAINFSEG